MYDNISFHFCTNGYTDKQIEIYRDLLQRFRDNFEALQVLTKSRIKNYKWESPNYPDNRFLTIDGRRRGYWSILFPWDPNKIESWPYWHQVHSVTMIMKRSRLSIIRLVFPFIRILVGAIGGQFRIYNGNYAGNPHLTNYPVIDFNGEHWTTSKALKLEGHALVTVYSDDEEDEVNHVEPAAVADEAVGIDVEHIEAGVEYLAVGLDPDFGGVGPDEGNESHNSDCDSQDNSDSDDQVFNINALYEGDPKYIISEYLKIMKIEPVLHGIQIYRGETCKCGKFGGHHHCKVCHKCFPPEISECFICMYCCPDSKCAPIDKYFCETCRKCMVCRDWRHCVGCKKCVSIITHHCDICVRCVGSKTDHCVVCNTCHSIHKKCLPR